MRSRGGGRQRRCGVLRTRAPESGVRLGCRRCRPEKLARRAGTSRLELAAVRIRLALSSRKTDELIAALARGAGVVTRCRMSGGCMLICMQSTSVRIDAATHDELKRLATELHTTVGNTVSLAVRALRQDLVGADLTAKLRDEEVAWLDAELG